MKNILFAALAMAFVFTACNSGADKTKDATNAATTDTAVKKEKMGPVTEQLYACSMHPEVIGKKNEKCSQCGMKLTVEVKNSETPE